MIILGREVAQWLVPRTSPAHRDFGGVRLIVGTDDPLGLASLTIC